MKLKFEDYTLRNDDVFGHLPGAAHALASAQN